MLIIGKQFWSLTTPPLNMTKKHFKTRNKSDFGHWSNIPARVLREIWKKFEVKKEIKKL